MAEEWSGDKDIQKALYEKIMAMCDGKPVVDIVGACETILANLVCDYARNYESALAGIDAVAGDMKQTVKDRMAS